MIKFVKHVELIFIITFQKVVKGHDVIILMETILSGEMNV